MCSMTLKNALIGFFLAKMRRWWKHLTTSLDCSNMLSFCTFTWLFLSPVLYRNSWCSLWQATLQKEIFKVKADLESWFSHKAIGRNFISVLPKERLELMQIFMYFRPCNELLENISLFYWFSILYIVSNVRCRGIYMCSFVAWNLVLHYYIWLEECVTVCLSPKKSLSYKTIPMLTVLLSRVAVSQ